MLTGKITVGQRFFSHPPSFSFMEHNSSTALLLASGDRDHILSGVFNQFLSEKSEPAE